MLTPVMLAVVQLSVSTPFNTPVDIAYPAYQPVATSRAYQSQGLMWVAETSGARMATIGRRPLGARVRYGVKGLSVEASWLMSHGWDATIETNQDINEFRLAPQGYTSVRLSQSTQENRHQIDLHTFSLGLQYNVWEHVTQYVAVSPGVGLQRTLVHDRATTRSTSIVWDGDHPSAPFTYVSQNSYWTNGNASTVYCSADIDVYPYGKKGHVGIGYTLRYVPSPATLSIGDSTLLDQYSIPIKERRWSVIAHIDLIF